MTQSPACGLTRARITGAVIAGGKGQRMGGADKGLLPLAGRPLAAWVLAALRPQVGALLLNANRSLTEYRALGVPVVADCHPGFMGPLAGIQASLSVAQSDYVLTVPCDTPLLPPDLAQRLGRALVETGADIVTVDTDGQSHPLHALIRSDLAADLDAALQAGVRKPEDWYRRHHWIRLSCDDLNRAFVNLNTPAQRSALEAELLRSTGDESAQP